MLAGTIRGREAYDQLYQVSTVGLAKWSHRKRKKRPEKPTCSPAATVYKSATDAHDGPDQEMRAYRARSAEPEHLDVTYNRRFRPRYSHHQKLSLMYHRILKDTQWQDILARFTLVIGEDSTDSTGPALRSAYYRTRRESGLDYVTSTVEFR